ncbi:Zinc finger matrin-type protein 5 [Gryllus bimaculatus]|nr:Zinc finger matrin-type protein 5 [Gryllus bimaculatus]
MGKRYYCDYCDRHFVDDLEARKKHLAGVMHMRMRKDYYNQFKDAETLYKEETAKLTCKRFQRFGECVFGSNCRFSHYSREDLELLKRQVEDQQRWASFKNPVFKEEPTLASWLEKRNQSILLSKASSSSSSSVTAWGTPAGFVGRLDLPPSLQPLKIEDFSHSDFDTWG